MAIQDTIIEAFKSSQAAHGRALATIGSLRSDNSALDAEVARLNAQVASLRSHIAHLEAEAVKIVEPASIQSFLASLSQIVEETQQATTPVAPRKTDTTLSVREAELSRLERMRQDDSPVSPLSARPSLRRILDREANGSDPIDISH